MKAFGMVMSLEVVRLDTPIMAVMLVGTRLLFLERRITHPGHESILPEIEQVRVGNRLYPKVLAF